MKAILSIVALATLAAPALAGNCHQNVQRVIVREQVQAYQAPIVQYFTQPQAIVQSYVAPQQFIQQDYAYAAPLVQRQVVRQNVVVQRNIAVRTPVRNFIQNRRNVAQVRQQLRQQNVQKVVGAAVKKVVGKAAKVASAPVRALRRGR